MNPHHKSSRPVAVFILFSMLVHSDVLAQDSGWRRFRGPNGAGIQLTTDAPTHWGSQNNIRWKSPLPGIGRSSPVVTENRIFLTAQSLEMANDSGFEKYLLCFDLKSGDRLWNRKITRTNGKPDEEYSRSAYHAGYAAATPVVDDEQVYVSFGSDGLFAFDFDGNQIWHHAAAADKNFWGSAGSPILYSGLVILNEGPSSGRLVAVDKDTGKAVWEYAEKGRKFSCSYTTPIIANNADTPEVVLSMLGTVIGVDPTNGRRVWSYSDNAQPYQVVNPVVNATGLACFSNRGMAQLPSLRSGDVSPHSLWKPRGGLLVASPVYYQNQILMVSQRGAISIHSDSEGEVLLQERLPGSGAGVLFYSSPLRIRDHWMILSSTGRTFLWDANAAMDSDTWSQNLISNELQESDPYFVATPAITDKEILIRSEQFLYCISGTDPERYDSVDETNESALNREQKLRRAMMLDTQVQLAAKQERYAEAIELSEEILQIRESALGKSHARIAATLIDLADHHQSLKQYSLACAKLERALAIREDSLGAEHSSTEKVVIKLAECLLQDGRYVEAEKMCLRSLRLVEALPPTRQQQIGVSARLMLLAASRTQGGQIEELESLFLRALSLREINERFGPGFLTVESLNNLARFYLRNGRLRKAEGSLTRALAISERAERSNWIQTANTLRYLSKLNVDLGKYRQAEEYGLRALNAAEKKLGQNHAGTTAFLEQLSIVYQYQVKPKLAADQLLRAMEIEEKSFGSNHSDLVRMASTLASVLQQVGKYDTAEAITNQVLKRLELKLGADHADVAKMLQNKALLIALQGNHIEAEPLYLRAIRIKSQIYGEQHIELDLVLENYAQTCLSLGKVDEAALLYDRSAKIATENSIRVLSGISRDDQRFYRERKFQRRFGRRLSFAHHNSNHPRIAELSATWLLNGKSIAQQALTKQVQLSHDFGDPKLAAVASDLKMVRSRLSQLSLIEMPINGVESLLSDLVRQEEEMSKLLNQGTGWRDDSSYGWLSLDAVRSAMGEHEVSVDMAKVEILDPTEYPTRRTTSSNGGERYIAWVVRADGSPPSLIDLGSAMQIDRAIEKARRVIVQGASSREFMGLKSVTEGLSDLTALIWKPLQASVGDADSVILCPDGQLWLAPWSALVVDAKRSRFLIEDFSIRLVNSGRDVARSPSRRGTTHPVIFANPQFGQQAHEKRASIEAVFRKQLPTDETATRSFSAKSLLPQVSSLPNTGVEAAAIKPNLEKLAGTEAVLYKERYALEGVAKALRRPKIASFATHGFFLPKQESIHKNHDRFPSNDTRSVAIDTEGKLIENPLLRCGLLLSGCNNRDSVVGDDDGILTGLEIVGIDFRGTEMVVLSACETGIGDVKTGEGVAGLRQAFQLAGAESVVATLWQVPDKDSALIMNDFFINLAAGQSRSAALRDAQLKRIASRRQRHGAAHPFFWAAWTLTGQN